jgi:hypothetical protein
MERTPANVSDALGGLPAASEFTVHYHRERNHQGLNNKLICPDPGLVRDGGEVKRRKRLGGLLNYYYRTAA